MKIRRFAAFFLCILLLYSTAFAHPGNTDENGGHYYSDTDEYHYHHGYPAHDHVDLDGDGIPDCKYEFDDKTGQNSGTSTNSSQTKTKNEKVEEKKEGEWMIGPLFVVNFVLLITVILLFRKIHNDKEIHYAAMNRQKQLYETKLSEAQSKLNQQKALCEKRLADKERECDQKIEGIKDFLAKIDADLEKSFGADYEYSMYGAPDGCRLSENCTEIVSDNDDESFVFRVSRYSYASQHPKYHSRKCRHGRVGQDINAFTIHRMIPDEYTPCGVCKPSLPDMEWADNMIEYIRFYMKYAPQSNLSKKYMARL